LSVFPLLSGVRGASSSTATPTAAAVAASAAAAAGWCRQMQKRHEHCPI